MNNMEYLSEVFCHHINNAKNAADLKSLIGNFHNALDQIFRDQLSLSKATIYCKEGCSHCCYLLVDASPGEIFRIVDYIRTHFSEKDISQLIKDTNKVRQKIGPMTLQECQNTPIVCPLLKDSRCSIYSIRPSFCRIYHSTNVSVCKAFSDPSHTEKLCLELQTVPEIESQTHPTIAALQAAYEKAGYDYRLYDLSSALHESLTTTNKETCWLRKEYAFSHQAVAKAYKQ